MKNKILTQEELNKLIKESMPNADKKVLELFDLANAFIRDFTKQNLIPFKQKKRVKRVSYENIGAIDFTKEAFNFKIGIIKKNRENTEKAIDHIIKESSNTLSITKVTPNDSKHQLYYRLDFSTNENNPFDDNKKNSLGKILKINYNSRLKKTQNII